MSLRYSSCFSFSSPNMRSVSTSEKPMMALRGVRSSWDMFARNSDLCWLATSSWRLLSWSSWNRRTFSMAVAVCCSSASARSWVRASTFCSSPSYDSRSRVVIELNDSARASSSSPV